MIVNNIKTNALVVLSGGQDSTTCLMWALENFSEVKAISFDYGQRHRVELYLAEKTAKRFNVDWKLLPINTLSLLGNSALVDANLDITQQHNVDKSLPASFVPGRNLILLTFAAAYAYQFDCHDLVTGVCQTDYSGYPDCRSTTIDSLAKTITLGMEYAVRIHTPMMKLTKAETWKMAHDLYGDEGIQWIVENTHTCYNGDRTSKYDWGYGCNKCPACNIRQRGYEEWRNNI